MSEPAEHKSRHRLAWVFALVGGVALLCAMAADFIAVIGRHTGFSLVGAIEIVQALVLISGSIAIVIAPYERSHAVVHLLVDRLSPGPKLWFGRINALFSTLFFVAATFGSGWIAIDMIGAHEVSELLDIPMLPLRLLCAFCAALCALLFARQLIGRSQS